MNRKHEERCSDVESDFEPDPDPQPRRLKSAVVQHEKTSIRNTDDSRKDEKQDAERSN